MMTTILPNATIGILGGGQLGRMLALSAKAMGYSIVTLDPGFNSPCSQVADNTIVADYASLDAAAKLAKCDVVTYEFENVDLPVVQYLEAKGYLPQGANLLEVTQNRIKEKEAIISANCQVAPFKDIAEAKDVHSLIQEIGLPAVLKTVTGGYDGKGQMVLRATRDIEDAARLVEESKKAWILEGFVPFVKELSVIVARNPNGEIRCYPVTENIHRDNILHISIAPARITSDVEGAALDIGVKLAQYLDLVGILAVELFMLADGTLLVNELAPRPHNSGHYTQQGCYTSQFEQHIRAICNLPLGNTNLLQPTVMVNILGEHLKKVLALLPTLLCLFIFRVYLCGIFPLKTG